MLIYGLSSCLLLLFVFKVNAGAVPQLLKLLSNVNPKVCEQALWVLGNIIGMVLYLFVNVRFNCAILFR